MHNLSTVVSFELIRTLKKPTFWISVLAIPILIGIIAGIIVFSNQSSQDTQAALEQEPFSFLIQDEAGIVAEQSLSGLDATKTDNKAAAIAAVKAEEVDAFFYYPANVNEQPIEIYNRNDGLSGNGKYSSVAQSLATAGASAQVDSPQLLAAIKGQLQTSQVNYQDGEEVNLIGRMIGPAIFLIIFYAIIVLLGGQMLASTTEEKENRVTEMLLTSLSSRALIVGKIIALVILGFIQIATILLPGLLAYFFARETLNIPDVSDIIASAEFELWPTLFGAGLLVSSFLLFTGLLVGIGAATPTAKEANSFFGFVILLMVIPFYFFSLLMNESNSVVVTGLSYFPLTAPITLMIRNIFGTLDPTEAMIGLTIVFVSGIIAINLAIRIFRYGTLEYSKRLSLRTIFDKKKKTL